MTSQITYYGYDASGNLVIQQTAENASDYINTDEARVALENLAQVIVDQLGGIANSLLGLTQDADEAIIVRGAGMGQSFEETAMAIQQLANSIVTDISQMYDNAIYSHQYLQNELNNRMHNYVETYPNVVTVR